MNYMCQIGFHNGQKVHQTTVVSAQPIFCCRKEDKVKRTKKEGTMLLSMCINQFQDAADCLFVSPNVRTRIEAIEAEWKSMCHIDFHNGQKVHQTTVASAQPIFRRKNALHPFCSFRAAV